MSTDVININLTVDMKNEIVYINVVADYLLVWNETKKLSVLMQIFPEEKQMIPFKIWHDEKPLDCLGKLFYYFFSGEEENRPLIISNDSFSEEISEMIDLMKEKEIIMS